ncbi:DUF1554 domain-containing protein [Leptospira kanakyensis]|uniref:DUF1554 domain-containing protein n=1 Tax=Leptospira kanakyensis TaxID=2484968 RepID=A0A6N4Q8R3_9LEPT|nr:DUF1554 domain-containing protein [Leptospira kanakyensis]TGK47553.1 DUF1554 domain-containing protein [Leptospira kanakyensis]TGK63444.1 DUF1554 domain-containing protein [Leptospira kanakyensis]TGK67047.1 DUF1554 domain-containing protein [Leptospira kanakyensis]
MFRYLFVPLLVLVFYCKDQTLNNACDINSDSYLESTVLFNLLGEGRNNCSTGTIEFFPTVIALSSKKGVITEGIISPLSFSVSLKEKPEAQVEIELVVSNPSYATVSPTTLSFDSTNWSNPKNIALTSINDSLLNGNREFRVILTPKSEDSKLDLNPAEIQMQILDNEKRMFLSAGSYRGGDFGGVTGADTICSTDRLCPSGSQCKAMILNGTTRIASLTANVGDGQLDWVLKPNAHYYLTDGTTLISYTNNTSLFQIPFSNSIDSVNYGAWFGGNADWVFNTNTSCFTWSAIVNTESGFILRTQEVNNLFFGATYGCGNPLKLLCVEY